MDAFFPPHGEPRFPALTSLTLHAAPGQLTLSNLMAVWIKLCVCPFAVTTLAHFATCTVPAPTALISLAHTFPRLATLDLRTSSAVLSPGHVAQLFKDLPLLHTLLAKSRKPSTMAGRAAELEGSTPGRNLVLLQHMDVVSFVLRVSNSNCGPRPAVSFCVHSLSLCEFRSQS